MIMPASAHSSLTVASGGLNYNGKLGKQPKLRLIIN